MSTTDRIVLIEAVLAYSGCTVHGAAIAAPEHLQPLVDLGVLVPAGHVPEVTCVECADSHSAPVVSTGSGWRAVCDRLGSAFTPEEDLTTYKVCPEPIIELLAATLDRRRYLRRPGCDPFFWSIGSFLFRDFRVGVFFLVGADDWQRIDEAFGWLRDEPATDAVAVLAIGADDLGRLILPREGRMVRFAEVMTWDTAKGLRLDHDALARLVLSKTLLEPVRGGRPRAKFKMALDLIAELDTAGTLTRLSSDRERHRVLLEALRARSGAEATLSRQTCKKAWVAHTKRQRPKEAAS